MKIRKLGKLFRPAWQSVIGIGYLLATVYQSAAADSEINLDEIRAAINKSLPLLESSADYSRRQRDCFTCHHVSFVSIAAHSAWQRGFKIDETNLVAQIKRTHYELTSDVKRFLGGRFPHGKGDLLGHSMWLLQQVGWKPDQTTAETVNFLLSHDSEHGLWKPDAQRPPTVGSVFNTTFVVLKAIEDYGTEDQVFRIWKRKRIAVEQLLQTASFDTEDMVYRLRVLHLIKDQQAELKTEAAKLLKAQREDGGWGQLEQMQSDPYATGTALAALVDTSVLTFSSPEFARGLRFLLRTQQDDGSWHVKSRVRAMQPFYQSGFPHGQDQFISASASAWATYTLLKAFPPIKSRRMHAYLEAHPLVAARIIADD